MRTKIFLILISFTVTFFYADVTAQSFSPDKVVDVKVKVNNKLSKDGLVEAVINLSILRGWHINSNKPLDNNLSPTSIKILDNPNFKVVKINFPPPLMKKLSFSDSQLALYEGDAPVSIELKSLIKGPNKKIRVEGEVDYQPCNDETCLFPVKKNFSFEIKLKK